MRIQNIKIQAILYISLLLLFSTLTSCKEGEPQKPFVDTTLHQRQEAIEIIENVPPRKQFVVCCQLLLENNGYGMFYNSHKKMFEAMANAPVAQRAATVGNHIFDKRFSKGKKSPITIKAIQKTEDFRSIREKALKLGLINRTEFEKLPDNKVITALFLDADLKSEFEGDSLYTIFRNLLLGHREGISTSASDMLEILLVQDSLFMQGEYCGQLSQILLGNESERLKEKSQEYWGRLAKKYAKQNFGDEKRGLYWEDFTVPNWNHVVLDTIGSKKKRRVIKNFDGRFISQNVVVVHCDSSTKTQDLLSLIELTAKENYRSDFFITYGDMIPVRCKFIGAHSISLKNSTGFSITRKDNYAVLIDSTGGGFTPALPLLVVSMEPTLPLDSFLKIVNDNSYNGGVRMVIDTSYSLRSNPLAESVILGYRLTPNTIVNDTSFGVISGSVSDNQSDHNGIGFGKGGRNFGSASGWPVEGFVGSELNVKGKKVKRQKSISGTEIKGGRSRANVMRTLRQNMPVLKYVFNRRLIDKPGLRGKVYVKWAIDEFGNVLHAKVVSGTMYDDVFEKELTRRIRGWSFGRIDIPGDVTEVTYGFVF